MKIPVQIYIEKEEGEYPRLILPDSPDDIHIPLAELGHVIQSVLESWIAKAFAAAEPAFQNPIYRGVPPTTAAIENELRELRCLATSRILAAATSDEQLRLACIQAAAMWTGGHFVVSAERTRRAAEIWFQYIKTGKVPE